MKHPIFGPELSLKQTLLRLSYGVVDNRWVRAWDGNLSVREEKGFWITPTRKNKGEVLENDLVFVPLDATHAPSEASSEWRFHQGIYRKAKKANWIIHTHPLHLMLVSQIPSLYERTVLGDEMPPLSQVPCIPHLPSGSSALAERVADEVKEESGAVVIASHGIITWAEHADKAYFLMDEKIRYAEAIYAMALIESSSI